MGRFSKVIIGKSDAGIFRLREEPGNCPKVIPIRFQVRVSIRSVWKSVPPAIAMATHAWAGSEHDARCGQSRACDSKNCNYPPDRGAFDRMTIPDTSLPILLLCCIERRMRLR